MKIEKLVPDTSVIIEELVSKKIESKEMAVETVIIHEAILAELEHQSNLNKPIGFMGLDEIKKIRELAERFNFKVEFSGKRPSASEIRHAKLGEIDAIIRELAYDIDGTLMTADRVQAMVAEAKGIKLILIELETKPRKVLFETFFDEATMSVHLRENVEPYGKKGLPGVWEFSKIKEGAMTQEEIKNIAKEIIEEAGLRRDSFIEIDRPGSTIVQLGNYRIVITRPPFSDGWEITAVKPIKVLKLSDYKVSEKLRQRLEMQAEGILIAGAPGMGKTTFAQALAEHYAAKNKIVKTVEAPRDLILSEKITQYAISHATHQEIRDVLLLSRPDYTIFDEMRNTPDFQLFADLRLAGVGMVGVIHATKPIDAIQRFIGRIELGVIPHIIDTVLFIKNGEINEIFSVEMEVKVPSGMTEADLARPVVVVSDFETGMPVFEIYTYGEQTVVVPVSIEKSAAKELAAKQVQKEFQRYSDLVKVDVVSENKAVVYVPEKYISSIIGKEGRNIERIEKKLGIGIDVRELGAMEAKKISLAGRSEIAFDVEEKGKSIIIHVDPTLVNKPVDIFIEDEFLMTVNVGKKGEIKFKKTKKYGKVIADALSYGEKIRVLM